MKNESLAKASERLTRETHRDVTIKCVRHLRSKGVDTTDTAAVDRAFRNSERSPRKLPEPAPSLGDIAVEHVAERERKLLIQLIDFVADADGDSERMMTHLILGCYLHYENGLGKLLGDSDLLSAEIRKITARLKRPQS